MTILSNYLDEEILINGHTIVVLWIIYLEQPSILCKKCQFGFSVQKIIFTSDKVKRLRKSIVLLLFHETYIVSLLQNGSNNE